MEEGPGNFCACATLGDWGQACDLRFLVIDAIELLKDLGASALEARNRKPDPGFGFHDSNERQHLHYVGGSEDDSCLTTSSV